VRRFADIPIFRVRTHEPTGPERVRAARTGHSTPLVVVHHVMVRLALEPEVLMHLQRVAGGQVSGIAVFAVQAPEATMPGLVVRAQGFFAA
jgi:hypothetical protein